MSTQTKDVNAKMITIRLREIEDGIIYDVERTFSWEDYKHMAWSTTYHLLPDTVNELDFALDEEKKRRRESVRNVYLLSKICDDLRRETCSSAQLGAVQSEDTREKPQ